MTVGNGMYISPSLEWRTLGKLTEQQYADAVDRITDRLFTNERKQVFEAIRQSYAVYGNVTPETLERFLKKPSPSELDVHNNVNLDAAIEELHRLAIKRQLKRKADTLASLAEMHDPNLDQIQQELEFDPILTEEDGTVKIGTQQFLTDLHHKMTGKYQFISTGFPMLDLRLGGEWTKRGLTLLGALPGTGKTGLALQSMVLMAEKQGTASLMINLEMAKKRLVSRIVANLASIDGSKLAVGDLDEDEKLQVEIAAQRLDSLPLYMVCNSDLDVTRIIGYIKDYIKRGVKVVFIDHLQLIKSYNDNRNNALGDIAWALKQCADKHDIAIILLSQLTKKDGRYVIRDSGEVESKCDVFMLLSSDGCTDPVRRITVELPKNRDGMIEEFPLLFNAPFQRFSDGS